MSFDTSTQQTVNVTAQLHHDVYPAIDPETTLKGSCARKTVLVTGAGRGIGQAIALAYALAGATTIIITSRTTSELRGVRDEILARVGSSVEVIAHATDISSEESVKNLFDMLATRNIILDVLVNNAGGGGTGIAPIHEADPAGWWAPWEINVKGTFLMTHFALKRHCASPTPRPLTIIYTSSGASTMTFPGGSSYMSSKSAVNRIAEFVHAEYAARGVRAFSVHPGDVQTKMVLDTIPKEFLHMFKETPALAGGFYVWLATQKAADQFQGKYVSALWDVEELVAAAEAKSAEEKGRWLTTKPVV